MNQESCIIQILTYLRGVKAHLGGGRRNGFTLIEMLVVISLLSVVGVMILTIFSRTLKGTNKAQIISLIKQNGQAVLENMDKTIRNSDGVNCSNTNVAFPPTIVVNTGSTYTRYKIILQTGTSNGYITREVFNFDASQANNLTSTLCTDYTDPAVTLVKLTDDNSLTGISVESGVITRNISPGFPDQVTISFKIGPGLGAPVSVAGQIDPAIFQTTVELRNN